MGLTTAATTRDRMIALIRALVPVAGASTTFIPFRNELGANFRKWARANPASCTRRFQVRTITTKQTSDVSNTDVEARRVTFEVIVAYAQSHRWGADAALDRDDAMESDEKQIEHTIGRDGYPNFPDASWLSPDAPGSQTETLLEHDENGPVDFLVIRQTMRFYRSTT